MNRRHSAMDQAHSPKDNSAESWDQRYAESGSMWSGRPNGVLVSVVAELPPGRALDVGCGEGADAVWLAQRGWDVTALDVSGVALDRAALHSSQAGAAVRLVHAGVVEASLTVGGFDLVSAQYPALLLTPDHDAESALLSLVAPGGLLLVVHHSLENMTHARERGFDLDDYVAPADVAALVDENWQIELDETRPRSVSEGAGAGHTTISFSAPAAIVSVTRHPRQGPQARPAPR